jgi:hypothetical protein
MKNEIKKELNWAGPYRARVVRRYTQSLYTDQVGKYHMPHTPGRGMGRPS